MSSRFLFAVASGTWAWATADTNSAADPHTIAFTPDHKGMIITSAHPYHRADGTLDSVAFYDIRGTPRTWMRGIGLIRRLEGTPVRSIGARGDGSRSVEPAKPAVPEIAPAAEDGFQDPDYRALSGPVPPKPTSCIDGARRMWWSRRRRGSPTGSPRAAPFVIVPPASLLLIAIVVPLAALIARRSPPGGDGV